MKLHKIQKYMYYFLKFLSQNDTNQLKDNP